MAKEPAPGRVKTRMVPPLSYEEAAELYACLLDDVLESSARMALHLGLRPVLAMHPASACAAMAARAPAGFSVVAQRGPDLANRMAWAVEEAFATGTTRVLMRGSDSPVLDENTLNEALVALDSCDLALCPDRDGGYNLIGLGAPCPALFDTKMSTGSVLDDTLAAAERAHLKTRVLEPGFDLDTVEDLALLASARAQRDLEMCRRTLAFLDARSLWSRIPGR